MFIWYTGPSVYAHTSFIIIVLTGIYLVPALIYRCRAQRGGTSVLLDVGISPPTERSEVRERGVVVVVSVPERVLAELSRTTHDRRPLAVTSVDT